MFKKKYLTIAFTLILAFYSSLKAEIVKDIVIEGNKRISEETIKVYGEIKLNTEDNFHVPVTSWHQITNPYKEPCHIIEIQYGKKTEEDDIERLWYFGEK